VIAAIETVISSPAFAQRALEKAPVIARRDPGTRGAFLGYDFHLGAEGPQLTEINTNAGGALLNVALTRAQRACCIDVQDALSALGVGDQAEAAFIEMFRWEWKLARGEKPLRSIAIVDENPSGQYLYPEFLMFRELFERAGLQASIVDSKDFEFRGGCLHAGGLEIDLVYNRLTDFYLEKPEHAALQGAYSHDAVVLTPGPRAHALYANKSHLAILSDAAALASLGVGEANIELLLHAVPKTVVLTEANRDEMWKERKRYFFMPAGG